MVGRYLVLVAAVALRRPRRHHQMGLYVEFQSFHLHIIQFCFQGGALPRHDQ